MPGVVFVLMFYVVSLMWYFHRVFAVFVVTEYKSTSTGRLSRSQHSERRRVSIDLRVVVLLPSIGFY